jgi:hypothetical protein
MDESQLKSIAPSTQSNEKEIPSLSSPNSLTLSSMIVKPPASASINSATPMIITMTKEELTRSIGFRQVEDFIKHMKTVSTPNIRIEKDELPRIDPGETASIKSLK